MKSYTKCTVHNPNNLHNSKKGIDLQLVTTPILCKSPCTTRAQLLHRAFLCVYSLHNFARKYTPQTFEKQDFTAFCAGCAHCAAFLS